jgi:hypothetical protein
MVFSMMRSPIWAAETQNAEDAWDYHKINRRYFRDAKNKLSTFVEVFTFHVVLRLPGLHRTKARLHPSAR